MNNDVHSRVLYAQCALPRPAQPESAPAWKTIASAAVIYGKTGLH